MIAPAGEPHGVRNPNAELSWFFLSSWPRHLLMPELAPSTNATRETFTSRFGSTMALIGVAVGLANIWRFPYMTGKFGGAAFVAVYLVFAFLLGVPAIMAEWTLGRHTRQGPAGAFTAVGMPGGKAVGILLFITVFMASLLLHGSSSDRCSSTLAPP